MLVLIVLCAVGLGLLFFALCRRAGKAPEIPASSPKSYMNDPAFMKQLDDMRKEREDHIVMRTKFVRELEKMIEAKKAEMPGADDEALKAALEKDPAWNDLSKRVADLTTAIKENGRKAQGIVRERIAPKKGISK